MKSKIKDAVIVTMIFVSSYNCYQIGKQDKIEEIKRNMVELDMEWYHYQDVEKIVEAKNIWSEYEN
jgi:hypothetical protein